MRGVKGVKRESVNMEKERENVEIEGKVDL